MGGAGRLVVIRGNSGSGKSTVAGFVQRRFDRGLCAVVSQDHVRRSVLREHDVPGAFTVDLIGTMVTACLQRGLLVVVEGILDAGRYQRMLAATAARAESARFFAYDLPWEETVRRHEQRPQREEFTSEQMRPWYVGWQPLDVADETRWDASVSVEDAVDQVVSALAPRG